MCAIYSGTNVCNISWNDWINGSSNRFEIGCSSRLLISGMVSHFCTEVCHMAPPEMNPLMCAVLSGDSGAPGVAGDPTDPSVLIEKLMVDVSLRLSCRYFEDSKAHNSLRLPQWPAGQMWHTMYFYVHGQMWRTMPQEGREARDWVWDPVWLSEADIKKRFKKNK